MKNIFFILRILVAVLVLGVTVVGCSSTRYGVEISNVHNVREIYIRNAGVANWGTNMANTIQNIDRSSFAERVDIRVIDTNGVAYSKYNVSFGDAAFSESGISRSPNLFALLGIVGAGLGVYSLINNLTGE